MYDEHYDKARQIVNDRIAEGIIPSHRRLEAIEAIAKSIREKSGE